MCRPYGPGHPQMQPQGFGSPQPQGPPQGGPNQLQDLARLAASMRAAQGQGTGGPREASDYRKPDGAPKFVTPGVMDGSRFYAPRQPVMGMGFAPPQGMGYGGPPQGPPMGNPWA